MKKFYAANEYWEDFRKLEEKQNDTLFGSLDEVAKATLELLFGIVKIIFGGHQMFKLFHKMTVEEKIARQTKKREMYYQKQWIQWIEPRLVRIEGMNIKRLKKYQDEYFENKCGIRDWLIDWAHCSNVCLPPLLGERVLPSLKVEDEK